MSTTARAVISRELEAYLSNTRLRKVLFARRGVAPPPLAYVTNFPRLSVPLDGLHPMQIGDHTRQTRITPRPGHVVYVGPNCWNKPEWSEAVKVLTFLFGKKQLGISLVTHDGRGREPTNAVKVSLDGKFDEITDNIMRAFSSLAGQVSTAPLDRMLAQSLLHACLRLLKRPPEHGLRKAGRTYEAICLYLQENFQNAITRESVARHFDLNPNHVSRLFQREGNMHFNDYLTLVRIDRAKFMLAEYSSTLKEIAANCGFQSVTYFCRVFKKMTKITPTEYRTQGL